MKSTIAKIKAIGLALMVATSAYGSGITQPANTGSWGIVEANGSGFNFEVTPTTEHTGTFVFYFYAANDGIMVWLFGADTYDKRENVNIVSAPLLATNGETGPEFEPVQIGGIAVEWLSCSEAEAIVIIGEDAFAFPLYRITNPVPGCETFRTRSVEVSNPDALYEAASEYDYDPEIDVSGYVDSMPD